MDSFSPILPIESDSECPPLFTEPQPTRRRLCFDSVSDNDRSEEMGLGFALAAQLIPMTSTHRMPVVSNSQLPEMLEPLPPPPTTSTPQPSSDCLLDTSLSSEPSPPSPPTHSNESSRKRRFFDSDEKEQQQQQQDSPLFPFVFSKPPVYPTRQDRNKMSKTRHGKEEADGDEDEDEDDDEDGNEEDKKELDFGSYDDITVQMTPTPRIGSLLDSAENGLDQKGVFLSASVPIVSSILTYVPDEDADPQASGREFFLRMKSHMEPISYDFSNVVVPANRLPNKPFRFSIDPQKHITVQPTQTRDVMLSSSISSCCHTSSSFVCVLRVQHVHQPPSPTQPHLVHSFQKFSRGFLVVFEFPKDKFELLVFECSSDTDGHDCTPVVHKMGTSAEVKDRGRVYFKGRACIHDNDVFIEAIDKHGNHGMCNMAFAPNLKVVTFVTFTTNRRYKSFRPSVISFFPSPIRLVLDNASETKFISNYLMVDAKPSVKKADIPVFIANSSYKKKVLFVARDSDPIKAAFLTESNVYFITERVLADNRFAVNMGRYAPSSATPEVMEDCFTLEGSTFLSATLVSRFIFLLCEVALGHSMLMVYDCVKNRVRIFSNCFYHCFTNTSGVKISVEEHPSGVYHLFVAESNFLEFVVYRRVVKLL